MTTYNGMTYTDYQVGIKESVTEELLMLNPYNIPLLTMVGFGQPIGNIRHEWIEDSMFDTETAVKTAVDAAATEIEVESVEPFQVNSVAKIGEEMVLVTAIDELASKITVTRGYANTTPAAATVGAVVEFKFVEGVEGADARKARFKKRERKENITQIFDETIEVSGTAQAMDKYGMNGMNQYDYNRAKALQSVALQLEKACIDGLYYENGLIRQMRGMRSYIQTNVDDAAGSALTKDMFNNMAQGIFRTGGFKGATNYVIMVPANQKIAVSAIDEGKIQLQRDESIRGQVVTKILTDFGEFPVVLNDNLQSDELFFVDLNRISIRPVSGREFFHKYLGDQGDYVHGQIIGEYTLEFQQEKAHGRIKGLK